MKNKAEDLFDNSPCEFKMIIEKNKEGTYDIHIYDPSNGLKKVFLGVGHYHVVLPGLDDAN